MKYFIVGLSAIFFVIMAPAMQAADDMRLLALNAPPYIYKLQDGSVEGLFHDRLSCILGKINQPFSVEIVPWTRAKIEVESGRAEGFFPTIKSDKYENYATLTDAVMSTNYYLYYLKESPIKPSDPDFKEKAQVSILSGTLQNKALEAAGYRLGPDAHSFEGLFDFLAHGRADAILISGVIARALLLQRGKLKEYDRAFHSKLSFGAYLSNVYLEKNPNLLKAFNKHINGCS